MRDVARLRENQKVSGNGQKMALAFCALLLLGGVFALGVLIGKRTAGAQVPAPGDRDPAALDSEARKPPPAKPAAPAKPPPEAAAPADPPARAAPEAREPVRAATLVPAPPRAPSVIPAPPAAAPPPPAAVAPLTPAPRDPGAFTVQVGASQDRAEAARLLGRLRSAGLHPYVVQANLGAKGSWYRIRVGSFRDKDSANRFRKDVERELRIAAVVMPTH